jgi:hypothetical protein
LKNLSLSLQEHFTSSIEPGYYEEGAFGIRIENVAVVVKAFSRGDIDWFTFDPVTFVPLSAKMIDMSLLTPDEVGWVDDYHVSHSYSSTGVQKLISTLDPMFLDINRFYYTHRSHYHCTGQSLGSSLL